MVGTSVTAVLISVLRRTAWPAVPEGGPRTARGERSSPHPVLGPGEGGGPVWSCLATATPRQALSPGPSAAAQSQSLVLEDSFSHVLFKKEVMKQDRPAWALQRWCFLCPWPPSVPSGRSPQRGARSLWIGGGSPGHVRPALRPPWGWEHPFLSPRADAEPLGAVTRVPGDTTLGVVHTPTLHRRPRPRGCE